MTIKIFDSYDATIYIAELIDTYETALISGSQSYTVDNEGGRYVYPSLEITTPTTANMNGIWLSNGTQEFEFKENVSLSSSDILLLDFENQVYKKNNDDISDIINFPNNEIIEIIKNKENEFEFTINNGEVEVKINYKKYNQEKEKRIPFVENFSLNSIINLNSRGNKTDERYTLNITKMPVDWELYDGISDNKEYRITYHEYNPQNFEEHKRALIEVKFSSWDRKFNMGEFVLSSISGNGDSIIKLN